MTWLKYKETWKKFLPYVSKDCECEQSGIIIDADMHTGRECECVAKAKALYHLDNSCIPDEMKPKNGLEPHRELLNNKRVLIQCSGLKLAKHAVNLLKEHCKAGRSVRFIELPVLINLIRERERLPKEKVICIHRADRYTKTDPFVQPSFDAYVMKHIANGGWVIMTVEDASNGYASQYAEMFGVTFLS